MPAVAFSHRRCGPLTHRKWEIKPEPHEFPGCQGLVRCYDWNSARLELPSSWAFDWGCQRYPLQVDSILTRHRRYRYDRRRTKVPPSPTARSHPGGVPPLRSSHVSCQLGCKKEKFVGGWGKTRGEKLLWPGCPGAHDAAARNPTSCCCIGEIVLKAPSVRAIVVRS